MDSPLQACNFKLEEAPVKAVTGVTALAFSTCVEATPCFLGNLTNQILSGLNYEILLTNFGGMHIIIPDLMIQQPTT